ncbi:hypothetical protein BHYA_0885g00020 [Botrytis hyacinthi]|uniref:Uncharacterized protein n=1 Tax=Botrytis hyacinthi TaxID=278943 RepID=A0A4Z1G7M4_9HELO|nr:hypothetical protein BHYA_0885g00020 [Botrytis hyacinthi]
MEPSPLFPRSTSLFPHHTPDEQGTFVVFEEFDYIGANEELLIPGEEMHEERSVNDGKGMDVVSESESEEIGVEDVSWEEGKGLRRGLGLGRRGIEKDSVGGF